MAIVTDAGRARIAELLLALPVHLAIGTGKEDWARERVPEEYTAEALVSEIGRKASHRKMFVTPNDHGEIILPNGKRYSASETPTKHLYFQFQFDYGDGAGVTISEIGLFTDTKVHEDSKTKTFITPDDIEDAGTLLLLSHLENPDTFNPQKKGAYELVYNI